MKSEEGATKKKILFAANDILDKMGYEHFTLDKIAQRAQVSKGGLLYHFPNKQALIEGMLSAELSEYGTMMDGILERANRREALEFLQDYIAMTFEEIASGQNYGRIAAIASSSKVINRCIDHEKKLLEIIELIDPDYESLLLLKMATDGIWFNYLAGIKFLSKEKLEGIKNSIMEMFNRYASSP